MRPERGASLLALISYSVEQLRSSLSITLPLPSPTGATFRVSPPPIYGFESHREPGFVVTSLLLSAAVSEIIKPLSRLACCQLPPSIYPLSSRSPLPGQVYFQIAS